MHGCPTFVHAACLPPLPQATFVRAPRLPSTSSTCVRTHCRTSLVHTAVVHSYTLNICHHYRWVPTYVLLVCRLHRRPAFVRIAEAHWYPLLSYIRTRCSYAVNTADLRSYALQNLVGTHRCPTFVHAARLPPLPLATFVCAACLPSTSSTCIPTHWITLLVCTAVLHSYALVLCRQHRRPGFARVAEHRWYPLLSYICTRCSYSVNIVDLHLHMLQSFVGTHCCPTFVCAARMPSTPLTCVRTHCRTSLVHTTVLHSHLLRICRHCHWLHSYALLVCCQHR